MSRIEELEQLVSNLRRDLAVAHMENRALKKGLGEPREVWVCYSDSYSIPVAVLDKPFTTPEGYTLVHFIEVTTP